MPDARAIESQVGHPETKWNALKDRIQADAIEQFVDVRGDWLDLMWTLDTYRREGVPPDGMGRQETPPGTRLNAIYRGKGNWFSDIITLLLGNQTAQLLGPRSKVLGFSQVHQVDIAWPVSETVPLICVETKVTGAPAYGSHGPRGARQDWSNRRRELKFSATDLKLHRRGKETQIEHWDEWRNSQPPNVYFLWASRLGPSDSIEMLIDEVGRLVNSYLDGAGVIAWREKADGASYEEADVPPTARVHDLDDVLYRIASEIRRKAD